MVNFMDLVAVSVGILSLFYMVSAESVEVKDVKVGKFCKLDSDCKSNFCFYNKCVEAGKTSKGGALLKEAYLNSQKNHDRRRVKRAVAKPKCPPANWQLFQNYKPGKYDPCYANCIKPKFVKYYPGTPDIMVV